jgi:hypothetical protein
MNLSDATKSLVLKHGTNEADTRAALIDTARHRGDRGFDYHELDDWSAACGLLGAWLTNGAEWVPPDWSDPRDAASWLLHRCTACTWAVLIAHNRARASLSKPEPGPATSTMGTRLSCSGTTVSGASARRPRSHTTQPS